MTANARLITRDDAKDYSAEYGPEWHAPLPDLLRPKMICKIGIRGNHVEEWPWARIVRASGDKVVLEVGETDFDDDHGISQGREIEARREHLHIVIVPPVIPTDEELAAVKLEPLTVGDRVVVTEGKCKGLRYTVVELDEEGVLTLRGPCATPGCTCVAFMRMPLKMRQANPTYLRKLTAEELTPTDSAA